MNAPQSNKIHSSSVISSGASLGENVTIGPYCVIGPKVEIGDGCILHSHIVMEGNLKIGKENQFYPFCSVGAPPQDLTYKGEDTRVEIGDKNVFREYVSIHKGSTKEEWVTKIGGGSFFMAHTHFGHDSIVGDECIMANGATMGGHVRIGDRVFVGGKSSFSPFVRVGRDSYIGGGSIVDKDIPLFCAAYGNRVRLKGVNIVGLKRQGHSREEISKIVKFVRDMEAASVSPFAFAEEFLSSSRAKENIIIESMCREICQGKVGIAPFWKKDE